MDNKYTDEYKDDMDDIGTLIYRYYEGMDKSDETIHELEQYRERYPWIEHAINMVLFLNWRFKDEETS